MNRHARCYLLCLLVLLSTAAAVGQNTVVTVTTWYLLDGLQTAPYSTGLSATGGFPPYTWSTTVGSLPPGLSLNPSTGTISGTPTTPGTSSFTVRATDSHSNYGTAALSLTIDPAIIITTSYVPSGVQNIAYNATLSATGGTPGYTWSVVAGSLPTGLSLNGSTGAISGTPTVTGTSNFMIQVTDSNLISATKSLSLVVNTSFTIVTNILPPGTVGVTYSATLTASGGVSPYTWSVPLASLPTGLTSSQNQNTAVISGLPTSAGIFMVPVQVTDSGSNLANTVLTITINAPLGVTTDILPTGTLNLPYSAPLSATGGMPPYTWSITLGSLPIGLSLNGNNGVISGTPTVTGTSNFTVQVTDSNHNSGSAPLGLTISVGSTAGILLWSSPTSTSLGNPTTFSAQVAGTGGQVPTGTVDFYNGSTDLGATSLAPVTDTNYLLYSSTFDNTNAWDFATGDNGNGTLTPHYGTSPLGDNTAYRLQGTTSFDEIVLQQTLNGLAGTSPVTFSIWLKSNTGSVQDVHISAYDLNTLKVTDMPCITTANWQRCSVTTPTNSTNVELSIGTAPGPWQVDVSIWGAQVEEAGAAGPYIGTTTGPSTETAGLATLTTALLGAGSNVIAAAYSGDGTYGPGTSTPVGQSITQLAVVTLNPLVNALVGTPYATTLSALGGTPPYGWAIVDGGLPQGLMLNQAGSIMGTPTTGWPTGGDYTDRFVVQVVDSSMPPNVLNQELQIDTDVPTACPSKAIKRSGPCNFDTVVEVLYPNQAPVGTGSQAISLYGCISADNNGSYGTLTLNLPLGFTQVGSLSAQPDGYHGTLVQGTINIAPSASLGQASVGLHQSLDGCQQDGGPLPYYVSSRTATVTLSRLSLTQVQATGTPNESAGTFSYQALVQSGSNTAGVSYAPGYTSTSKPTVLQLSDPPNSDPQGNPTPGGLETVNVTYQNGYGGYGTDSFNVPTFGVSCYFTPLQPDWGSPPDSCSPLTLNHTRYDGVWINPPGLPQGTYCNAFLHYAELQGSAELTNGTLIQWNRSTNQFVQVSQINGSDGTPVRQGQTVARDCQIIPSRNQIAAQKRHCSYTTTAYHLDVDQIGSNLEANDLGDPTQKRILGYRLDLYNGAGEASCQNYNNRISVAACNPGISTCPASTVQ